MIKTEQLKIVWDKFLYNIIEQNENLNLWSLSKTFAPIALPFLLCPLATSEKNTLCDILLQKRVIGLTLNLVKWLT